MCTRTQLDDGWRASYGNDSRPWLISGLQEESKKPMISTMKESFSPAETHKEASGPRRQLLKKLLIDEVSEKLKNDMTKEEEPEERGTEYDDQFLKDGFDPSKINERNEQDFKNYDKYPLYYDAARSIWMDKKDTVSGVTQSHYSTPTAVFRRNASFTKPIGQILDLPKPGTIGYK